MFRLTALLGIGATVFSMHAAAQSRLLLPTVYEAGHFYATPQLPGGKAMRLLVDTGGAGGSGMYAIDSASAQRFGLDVAPCAVDDEKIQIIKSPPFLSGKGLPPSTHTPCSAAAIALKGLGGDVDGEDGLLGAGYLPGHIWTFDYPDQKLWLEPRNWRPPAGAHRTALHFQKNNKGESVSGFARITLKVDGEPLDLLLDTGATAKPTAAGKEASGTPTEHGIGVTSYITTSVLNRWHQQHPNWRVVADGDNLLGDQHATRLIEVPKVEVADWVVGPVWFTERPDKNFHDFMSKYTDQRIEGSAGGNIFVRFAMTLDYPGRAAWFTCAAPCKIANGP